VGAKGSVAVGEVRVPAKPVDLNLTFPKAGFSFGNSDLGDSSSSCAFGCIAMEARFSLISAIRSAFPPWPRPP